MSYIYMAKGKGLYLYPMGTAIYRLLSELIAIARIE